MSYESETAPAEPDLPTADDCHKRLAEASARYRQRIEEMSARRDKLNEQLDYLNLEHRRIEAAAQSFTPAEAAVGKQNWTGDIR